LHTQIAPSSAGGSKTFRCRALPTRPVLSEISDLTPCPHAQSNILHIKYAEKTDE